MLCTIEICYPRVNCQCMRSLGSDILSKSYNYKSMRMFIERDIFPKIRLERQECDIIAESGCDDPRCCGVLSLHRGYCLLECDTRQTEHVHGLEWGGKTAENHPNITLGMNKVSKWKKQNKKDYCSNRPISTFIFIRFIWTHILNEFLYIYLVWSGLRDTRLLHASLSQHLQTPNHLINIHY